MPRTLVVRPLKAELTHDVDWLAKMDPYIVFTLGLHSKKSSVCKDGGKAPTWSDVITFDRNDEEYLVAEVKDHETFVSDKSVGIGNISIMPTLISGNSLEWIDLTYESKPAGRLLVELIAQDLFQSTKRKK